MRARPIKLDRNHPQISARDLEAVSQASARIARGMPIGGVRGSSGLAIRKQDTKAEFGWWRIRSVESNCQYTLDRQRPHISAAGGLQFEDDEDYPVISGWEVHQWSNLSIDDLVFGFEVDVVDETTGVGETRRVVLFSALLTKGADYQFVQTQSNAPVVDYVRGHA